MPDVLKHSHMDAYRWGMFPAAAGCRAASSQLAKLGSRKLEAQTSPPAAPPTGPSASRAGPG